MGIAAAGRDRPAAARRGRSGVRVLIASGQWFPDRTSGYARAVSETAWGLARRGHEVTVLVPTCPGKPVEEQEGRLTVVRAVRRSVLPLTFTDIWETRRLSSMLAADFDLAVAHSETQAVGLLWAGLGLPLVLVYHAPVPLEARFDRSFRPFGLRWMAAAALGPALAALERMAVRRATRILVLSDYVRQLLLARYPAAADRVRRVSGGVDVDWFSPGDRAQARSRLGVGEGRLLLFTARRLEPRMGLENLLVAVSRLRRSLPVVLAVAGEGSLREILARRVAGLGLEETVRLLGRVSEEELRDWYRAADLFVLPTVAYEGFGLVTVEALACGTPVVGTPVGATPEILAPLDPDLVAADSDPAALEEAIRRCLGKTGDLLRQRCREYACGRFSWRGVLPSWERALAEVAARQEPIRPEGAGPTGS